MKEITTQIEEVISYCRSNDRVCPMPNYWNILFNKLKNIRQLPSGGWEPSLPLILSAWHKATVKAKQIRLTEHIYWAAKENQLNEIFEYLKGLKEENWFHIND